MFHVSVGNRGMETVMLYGPSRFFFLNISFCVIDSWSKTLITHSAYYATPPPLLNVSQLKNVRDTQLALLKTLKHH